jgi:hypothetical protein
MKTRTVLSVLLVAAALLTAAAASNADAPTAEASRVTSGGQYVLTIQSPAVPPLLDSRSVDWVTAASQRAVIGSGGDYRLLAPAQPAADGDGCCCKCRLPLILKK